jgi:hypothetical protein
MREKEKQLKAEVQPLLKQAEAADAEEDLCAEVSYVVADVGYAEIGLR